MNFLTKSEVFDEIKSSPSLNAIILALTAQRSPPALSYRVPVEASRQIALGRVIADLVDINRSPTIWIASTYVTCENEDLDLLRGYFRGFGELRDENVVPALRFGRDENDALLSMIRMALFFRGTHGFG